jgi:hypothetical protein
VAFKRQVVLGGRYIVDFFAPSVVSVAVPNRVIPVRSAGGSQNSAPIWAS